MRNEFVGGEIAQDDGRVSTSPQPGRHRAGAGDDSRRSRIVWPEEAGDRSKACSLFRYTGRLR